MFSSLRHRFGIPGAIAVFALVFAMVSGAYAAKSVIITKLNQISPSVQKQLKGKAGAPGAIGAAGAPGAKGDVGPVGPQGKEGPMGIQGKQGKDGLEGSPWTAGGTLPSGSTETGIWGTYTFPQPEGPQLFTISFTVPLAQGPGGTEPVERVYVGPSENKTAQGCPGYVGGIPAADPGKLCVYADQFANATREGFYHSIPGEPGFAEGVSTTGTLFNIQCAAECAAAGTWAVTAQ
jgi:collagen triple helix repeat protein